ncbi:MAG: Peptide chain release factor 2 [Chlamydiia bacterium]|nr:Peptide chain release factor 2 [Chlamydiia bacterium]
MSVSREKWAEIAKTLESLGIREEDLVEKQVLGSGPGGQKVNKTASAIWIKHVPTGITARCSEDRSLDVNRYRARKRLIEAYKKEVLGEKTAEDLKREKIRKQKKRRKRRQEEG